MKQFNLILLFVLWVHGTVSAQESAETELHFNPTFILPRTGTARPLYGVAYSLTLTKDTLSVDLPYQGRAWSVVNPNPQYQGIRFASIRFTITTRERKGVRTITLLPKDAGDVYRLRLTIPQRGESTLDVWSDRRDMVSFTGSTSPPLP